MTGLRSLPAHLIAVLLAGLVFCSGVLLAQNEVTGLQPEFAESNEAPQSKETSKQTPDIRSLSNLVITPVTVINSDGEFIYDLKQSDFTILDNGTQQRIESFESEPRPMALVIVVQTSRSVADLLDPVHTLGSVFSSLLLGPQGQAAVVTYGDRVKLAQDFSADSDQLTSTLVKIAPEGINGRLNDALMRAFGLLERRPRTERRIAIVFSNGYDDSSESKREEVVRRATGSEVAIYGLAFNAAKGLLSRKPEVGPIGPLDANVTRPLPTGGAQTPTASANIYQAPIPIVDILDATGKEIRSTVFSNLLEYYSGYTGGVYYSHWKNKTLADQISRIAAEVNSQYELAYVPDSTLQGGFHRISVKVRRPGLKVRARAGYFFQVATTPGQSATGESGHPSPEAP